MHRHRPYSLRRSKCGNDLRILHQDQNKQEPGPMLKDAWRMVKIVPDIYKQCGTLMSDEKRRESNILWINKVLKDQGYVISTDNPSTDAVTATSALRPTTTVQNPPNNCSEAQEYLLSATSAPSLKTDGDNHHREETQCTYPLRITQKNHEYRAVNLTLDQGAYMVMYEEENCTVSKASVETLWESAVVAAVIGNQFKELKEIMDKICLEANMTKLSIKQLIILQAIDQLLGTAHWKFLGTEVVLDGSTGSKKIKVMYETQLQVGCCCLIKPVIFGALGENFNPQGSFIFYRSPQTWHVLRINHTDRNNRTSLSLYCDYEVVP